MRSQEDKDIKFFHPSSEETNSADGDTLALAQVLDSQRGNGNLVRARSLGEQLSTITPENAEQMIGIDLQSHGIRVHTLAANVLYQIRVLMLFTAQITLHSALPSVLSAEAVNTMYDRLRESSEGFYDNVMEGTSFSFYYLAVRKGVLVDENVGTSFAMLCGDDDDEELAALGTKVYIFTREYVAQLVEKYRFVK